PRRRPTEQKISAPPIGRRAPSFSRAAKRAEVELSRNAKAASSAGTSSNRLGLRSRRPDVSQARNLSRASWRPPEAASQVVPRRLVTKWDVQKTGREAKLSTAAVNRPSR